MKKFEYDIAVNCEIEDLNRYGLKGWELVAVAVEQIEFEKVPVFYFKREIES